MARVPVTEIRGGVAPRQRIWNAIRAQGKAPWTPADIVAATHAPGVRSVDEDTTKTYISCLLAGGVIALCPGAASDGTPLGRRSYVLMRDEGIDAPRLRRDGTRVTQGLAQEQMWRALRMLKGDINARELAAYASSSLAAVSEVAAKNYLYWLDKAGYLACTQEGKGTGRGGVQARYRLRITHDTGPRPPMVCRTKVVFDANLREVVYAPVVTEEDAE